MNMLPYSGFPALPKNIEDMHAQLVALGLNDAMALAARISKCEDWVAAVEETELTGNPVTFNNALAVPAIDCEATLSPIQDLHGYDYPWAGGAGKNKLSNNLYTDGTSANVTWEKLPDGRIKVKSSGAVSTSIKIDLGKLDVVEGSYIVTGVKSNAPNYIDIRIMSESTSGTQVAFCNNSTTSATFSTTASTEYYGVIIIIANFNGEAILEPMVRLASIADDSFLPYSNICPISGRTAVVVERTGQNLWDEDYAGIAQSIKYTPVYVGDGSFTLRTTAPRWDNSGCAVFLLAGSASSGATNADHGAYNGSPRTQTAVNGYVTVAYRIVGDIDPRNYDTELIKASEIINATIQLGQTVYGGEVNFDTGVATVTDAIVDMGDLEWDYQTSYTRFMSTGIASSVKLPTGVVNAISSAYRAVNSSDVQNNNGTFGVSGSSGNLFVHDERYTDATTFKTAMTGQTICYKLATPTTLQLTPAQLQMLKGYNRVSSTDADSLTVKAYTGGPWEAVTRTIKKVTNKTKTTKKRRK